MRAEPRSRDPASLRPQPKRRGYDWWATPRCLTAALIEHVLPDLRRKPIWECAAGDGRLAQALRDTGYIVFASDVEPRGDGVGRRDFLRDEPPQAGLIACTNPPFNQLNRFIARGLQLVDCGKIAGLVLLVRLDTLTAASRAHAFNRAAAMLICCWRPVWIDGTCGGGRWSNAWIVWLADYRGPPATHWLPPERQQRQSLLSVSP
jgi:hypothetical protein